MWPCVRGVVDVTAWLNPPKSRNGKAGPPFSFGATSHLYLLEIMGLFTHGLQPVRIFGESLGGIIAFGLF
jgi:hypothetical protein